ncbi:unnamed protein product [Brassica rapa subsp. trilocularis]
MKLSPRRGGSFGCGRAQMPSLHACNRWNKYRSTNYTIHLCSFFMTVQAYIPCNS